jgi:hypothetical protein
VTNDHAFIAASLDNLWVRNDRLLNLVDAVADEDPFAALRLLKVSGVQQFGHIISTVPPSMSSDFAHSRNKAVTFATIQQEPPTPELTHSLPAGAGGAELTSLARHVVSSYLVGFSLLSETLHHRLVTTDDSNTNRYMASMLVSHTQASAT